MADISFQKDAQELVLTPIENMIMKLEKISKIWNKYIILSKKPYGGHLNWRNRRNTWLNLRLQRQNTKEWKVTKLLKENIWKLNSWKTDNKNRSADGRWFWGNRFKNSFKEHGKRQIYLL
jgi:hypothetical protein